VTRTEDYNDPRLFIHLPLEQLERGMAIAHAAGGPKDALNVLRIRIVEDPFEQWGVVFEATDTVVAAQRHIRADMISHGIVDTEPESFVVIPADNALRIWNAMKQQVITDRGKYDPTGWNVAINRTASRNPDAETFVPDVEFVLVDVFFERRFEGNTSQWQGRFPDLDSLFAKAGVESAVSRIRFAHRYAMKVIKSVGDTRADAVVPAITFHGVGRPISYRLKGVAGWRALQVSMIIDPDAVVEGDGEEE
jgi:hypothetical protein